MACCKLIARLRGVIMAGNSGPGLVTLLPGPVPAAGVPVPAARLPGPEAEWNKSAAIAGAMASRAKIN